ncbi:NAD-glutamate dehydrogenase [Paeniglutamicibacter kerguelensis]|uniref:Glutamate dehydrogenase n=1 Tax=Paeniglutamicibacter kerguelensis TaxID=254788 RepID=A0ABS4XDX2_9MICC|nr:NAD-glutamate dehydrogenase [Paeniglutamicibacter kerguelensis]MBP2386667.1 glutamate dehydrogenase [Paeniglutamicibacter kerguelensis]
MSETFIAETLTADLVGTYYGQLAPEDAAAYSPEQLESRVVAHLAVGWERDPKSARVSITRHAGTTMVYVVTDDMPFLVDSVTAEIVRQKAAINIVVHPTFVVSRDSEHGRITSLETVPAHEHLASGDTAAMPSLSALVAKNRDTAIESWIAVELGGDPSDETVESLIAGLERILVDVRAAVEDWSAMRNKAHEIADSLALVTGAEQIPDLNAAVDLLHWLDDGNFTFLGYRDYDLVTENNEDVLRIRPDSGLGLMRNTDSARNTQHLTKRGRAMARDKRALVITKANSRSTVHRGVYLDYVGIKRFDAQGNVNGERRFIGLFASSVYTSSVRSVPVVREKVKAVLRRTGFAPDSHSGKDIVTILETYPRDELFQISVEDLTDTVLGILRLQERRRTSLFLRPDVYGRFMSALVYLPRDRYTTGVRLRIEKELTEAFNAESVDFEVRMSESALVRLFYRIRLQRHGLTPVVDRAALETRLVAAVRSWSEGISEAATERYGAEAGTALASNWAEAFPAAYRVDFEVEEALADIERFGVYEEPDHVGPVIKLYVPEEDEDSEVNARMKLYLTAPLSLSKILPVLQNLGLEVIDERPFAVTPLRAEERYLYDLGLKFPAGIDPLAAESLLEAAYSAIVTGVAESDHLNRLVLRESMGWREVALLRAYAKYLHQLGVSNSYSFVSDTLVANPDVTHGILALFKGTFDPILGAEESAAARLAAHATLAEALEKVPTLDADKLLRRFVNVIEGTLRTNYYTDPAALAFKLMPGKIDGAPFPRPKYEIWVCSPRVEGVHLRFGEVARGGLRWSDRRDDFRTEVLGLVKAQMVKNAVIVPTGAKGGFFAKQLPNPAVDRGAWMEEGKSAYRIFIRSLLEITDNLVTDANGETVVPPANVVRLDGDDTYLVVAADKGTASFSDIANSISEERGHWLGDAFASGGSIGYDHKAMGITARGAWESVKRHFTEFGVDTQTEEFTAAGVGDMSGDVFGNGLLRTRTVKLVAAFDHRDIFLDPNPDAGASFVERARLFELPRSSWADYNKDLISAGGGVFSRTLKSIPISPEVRDALGLGATVSSMAPTELLKAILGAPVDLLYNGGIGTYVKASTETHAEVGDRANDAIRVDGKQIRAKVIGEGGNLGMTQLGRIEAALHGVLLNTDAIDNSAGVDCSDHEVNIKIFVDRMVRAGKIDKDERSAFLHSMTDEVSRLVLKTNFDQNVMLLNDKQEMASWSPAFERQMDWLEEHADLNRALEFLPTNEQLEERLAAGQTLTVPELSVLVAYAKIQLASALAASDLPDDPYFAATLRNYFPVQLAERFGEELDSHPLRREIIATVIANDMVNVGGTTYAFRVMEETGATESQVAKAFVALRDIYSFDSEFDAINALAPSFDTQTWCRLHLDMRRLLDRATRWYIHHVDRSQMVTESMQALAPTIQALRPAVGSLLRGSDDARVSALKVEALGWGLEKGMATRWAEQFESFVLLDIAAMATRTGLDAGEIAKIYYVLYDRFGVDALLERITSLPRADRWQALARAALRDDLYSTIIDFTRDVIEVSDDAESDPVVRVDAWEAANEANLERAKNMFAEVNRLERDDMASLSVALRLLRSIVRR